MGLVSSGLALLDGLEAEREVRVDRFAVEVGSGDGARFPASRSLALPVAGTRTTLVARRTWRWAGARSFSSYVGRLRPMLDVALGDDPADQGRGE